jgi:Family of unknown function (DUF5367)
MKAKDKISLVSLGFAIWAAATLAYRMSGQYFFEGSTTEYWLNVIFTSILVSAVFLGMMKWLRIEQKDWLQGAICLALPGMLGEIPILYGFSELMISMQPEIAGRYAAFLFGNYSCLISFAWFMSTRANFIHVTDTQK